MKYHILTLITTCFLLTFIWFHQGNIIGGGDEGLLFYSPTTTLNISKTTWIEYGTGTTATAWLPRANLFYFYSILEKIGIPTFILQASLIFVILSVGVISVYYLCLILLDENEKSKLISLVAAIFYLFNPFTTSQVWTRGLSPQHVSFALLPLTLLLFVLGIKRRNFLFAILIVLTSSIFSAAFGFLTFIIVYWFILFVFLIFTFFTTKDKLNITIFDFIFIFLTFFLWVIVHAWWLIPFVASVTSRYSTNLIDTADNLGTLMGVSQHFPPLVIIRLLQKHYFFNDHAYSPIYSSFTFQSISFLIPLFLIFGLFVIFKRKEFKELKFFVLLFTIGLIVSLGANPPLGWFFVWIFKAVPALQMFRNPFEKFGIVYALAYSPIFAIGLVYFFEKIFKKRILRFLGLTIILFLICGIYAYPMWTGKVMAGSGKKPGIDVPDYYKELNNWLVNHNEGNYRTFMTPLWGGDGGSYSWNNTYYQGADPMLFILNVPVISNTIQSPYYYDFIQNFRRYMERINVVSTLSLLRAKYLVNRKDAVGLMGNESEQKKYLTEEIYLPSDINNLKRVVCENQSVDSRVSGVAWIICQVSPADGNWQGAKYLHVVVKTSEAADLEVAIRDNREIRPRWDGRRTKEYTTSDNDWHQILIPIGSPSEGAFIDLSNIRIVEVLAHPKGQPNKSVDQILLKGVWPDVGKKIPISEFKLIKGFGLLDVYEPINFYSPPEFGVLTSIQKVNSFEQLFRFVENQRQLVVDNGLMVTSQNDTQNSQQDFPVSKTIILNASKISDTRYWIQTDGTGDTYVLLSKNFDPQWKLMSDLDEKDLKNGFLNDLKLLKRVSVSEDNHFVVNGYANLWKVGPKENKLALVFIPQIIADIGAKISIISGAGILLLASLYFLKLKILKNVKLFTKR